VAEADYTYHTEWAQHGRKRNWRKTLLKRMKASPQVSTDGVGGTLGVDSLACALQYIETSKDAKGEVIFTFASKPKKLARLST
jgi:hypothetical protein